MSEEQILDSELENNILDCFKDAICINANRIYDSCSNKDCIENLPIYFPDCVQPLINRATNVKAQHIDVLHANLDVEPVPFNKGFYSIDITIYFKIKLSVIEPSIYRPTKVNGLTMCSKKVILYGGEGNVKTFSSYCSQNTKINSHDLEVRNLPKAIIQLSKPITLNLQLISLQNNCCLPTPHQLSIPKNIAEMFEGEFNCCIPEKIIYISIGLFSITQLERNSQIMVPIYDFCIPNKDCNCSTDSPCDLFKKIQFPTEEFFPPSIEQNKNINN